MVYFPELLSVVCRGIFRLPRLYTHLSHCIAPEMAITVTGWGSTLQKYVVIVAWIGISSNQRSPEPP